MAAIGLDSAMLAVTFAPAAAQESRERGAEVVRERDGPYIVAMRVLPETPHVGRLNFTVTVESVAGSELVQGAKVEVVATDPDGDPDWLSPAIAFPLNPTSYVGNGEFAQLGEWRMEVRVSGPEGESTIEFPLKVRALARSGKTAGALAFAGALLVAASGAAWLVLSIRRSQRRRRDSER